MRVGASRQELYASICVFVMRVGASRQELYASICVFVMRVGASRQELYASICVFVMRVGASRQELYASICVFFSSMYLHFCTLWLVGDFINNIILVQITSPICSHCRTLACSIGRGMLTLASLEPLMAEVLPIPPLSLSGRVPPANSVITLDTSSAHSDLTLWPEFHNGVAASLRVGPREASDNSSGSRGRGRTLRPSSGAGPGTGGQITRNWIMYNRTGASAQPGGEVAHAGE